MKINLSDKTVLITGGSRGIGAACTKLFCSTGAKVVFTLKENLTAAEKLIESIQDNRPEFVKIDFASEESIINGAKYISDKYGKIDILVNNAGIWKYGAADSMSINDWEETIKINLTGVFLITREIIKLMKKNNYGRIINITSTAGQRGEAFHSHYAASKGALISYTKSLANELSEFNITTNSVAPGWVDTEMCDEVFADKDYKEQVRQSIPVGRIASPEDIAGPVLFLATDLARHINGEILNVNGGSVLCG